MAMVDTEETKKTIKVGLLWHSLSSGNLGVGALTMANMALINHAANNVGISVRFKIIGNVGKKLYDQSEFVDSIDIIEFSMGSFVRRPRLLWDAIKDCDLIFDIGEGDSFSDIYGMKRLAKLLIGQFAGHFNGVPYVIAPQTIGPFKNPFARKLAFSSLSKCHMLFSRDGLSQKHLLEQGLVSKSKEVIDVAFALPFKAGPDTRQKPVKVGFNVSGLLYNGGYSGGNQFNLRFDYREFIHDLLENFISKDDVEIHLVPHVLAEKISEEDDFKVSLALAKKYPGMKVPDRFRSPIEAKNYIAGLDFFSGARMHSTIAAFSSGVPVVPIAYSRKFNGLYSSLNYPYVVDGLLASHEEAMKIVLDSFENRDCLRKTVEKSNHIASERLTIYRKAIEGILVDVNG